MKVNSPILKMTIGVSPSGSISLDNEIRLLKVALLYADHAVLCSPGAFILNNIGTIRNLNDVETFMTILPSLVHLEPSLEANIAPILGFIGMMSGSRAQRRLIPLKIRNEFKQNIKNIHKKLNEIADRARLPSIEKAIKTGIIEIYQFNGEYSSDDMIIEYTELLSEAVMSGRTYPLFDNMTSNLVRAGLKEEVFEASQYAINRGKQAQLASYLFNRLPLFEAASIDEILDIRKELQRPLIRFRAAMIDFSSDIKNAAWDNDFNLDAENVFIQKVEPAIQDIEDSIRSNSIISRIVQNISRDSVASGSLLAVMLNQFAASEMVSAVVGIGTLAGITLTKTYKDSQRGLITAEQNHLFFYYKLRRNFS